MKMKRLGLLLMVVWAAGICFAPCAFSLPIANLPSTNMDSISVSADLYAAGQGFGAVTNLLTLQNDDLETGSIMPPGDTRVDITDKGTVKNTSQTYTVGPVTTPGTLKYLGFTADNLVVVFNISEPGNLSDVTLDYFSLDFYDSSNTPIGQTLTIGLPKAGIVPVGGMGTGTDGVIMPYVDMGFLTEFFKEDTNILGATGSVSKTTDGQENFSLGQLTSLTSVPEPTTLLLLGLGLVGLAGVRRKFKK